jgi:Kef-type K+ transport system membrane component KefB
MNNLELFVKVALALVIILAATRIVGTAARWIAQPRVVGEMIAGVILGPTIFGKFFPATSAAVFEPEIMPMLFVIANIGLTAYMFLVGTEINLSLFNRKLMRDAGTLSGGGILVPFACGFLLAGVMGDVLNTQGISYLSFSVFLGTAFAITAFPMLARILQDRGIIDTHLGGLAMVSASLQDVVSWILLGLVTALAVGSGAVQSVLVMVFGAGALVLFLLYVVRPFFRRWLDRMGEGAEPDQAMFAAILFLLILCALITDHIGLYSVFGGFILGIAMPRRASFVKGLSIRLKDITVILFLPVFFAFSGLNTDLNILAHNSMLIPGIIIIGLAFASKLIPLFGVMRLSGYNFTDSASIAALMNSRGLMELIIANIGLFYGLIDLSLFAILVLVAVTTTLAAMPLYVWVQKYSNRQLGDGEHRKDADGQPGKPKQPATAAP